MADFPLARYTHIRLPEDVARLEMLGLFNAAKQKIHDLLKHELPEVMVKRLQYELVRIDRLLKDYSVSEKEAIETLKKEFPGITEEKIKEWINRGLLDFIFVEGEKRFYRQFLSNLLFLCKDDETCLAKKRSIESREDRVKSRDALKNHVLEIIDSGAEGFVSPRTVRVRLKVTLKPNAVPPGETVRCWLPFPRVGDQQTSVKLLSCHPKNYVLAPPDHPQRTIYFEQEMPKDKPLEFWVEFEYTVHAFFKRIDPAKVEPYDETSEVYKRYTREEPPHIVFTPYLKELAYSIVGDEKNPYLKARKIYDWLTRNLTYTYVSEYCTYESIPEFVARNLRGDCGFQALLFITLCRIVGVPARWQSGWYANPIEKGPGPHDWAQFYIEPYGWLFADLSFGRRWRELDKRVHEFYFGNIDNFRTVFNIDIMSQFEPPKKFLRSDPVDNQRGELEWSQGNIYFDEFKTEMIYI